MYVTVYVTMLPCCANNSPMNSCIPVYTAVDLPDRARGKHRAAPVFSRELLAHSALERGRAALLTIEAALPKGAWAPAESKHTHSGSTCNIRINPCLLVSGSGSARSAA